MSSIWKIIEPKNYKDIKHCIKELKKNGFHVSMWIEDICNNKKNKIRITSKKIK